jgi:histidine phosphotransfer protein HptB
VSGGRLDNDVHALDPSSLRTLSELVGGDRDVLAELVDAFLDEAPKRLAELRLAAGRGDAALARRAAHTLKSNALTFGAGRLGSLSRGLEIAAATGAEALAADRGLIDDLEGEWARVRGELAALREDPPP